MENLNKYGTIAYWKEQMDKATDLKIVAVSKSNNSNWDKGMYNYFKIFIVINGQIEEIRFTNNETKENLKRLPLKYNKSEDSLMFHESVIGSNRFHEILYHLGRVLYEGIKNQDNNNDEGYTLIHRFRNYEF